VQLRGTIMEVVDQKRIYEYPYLPAALDNFKIEIVVFCRKRAASMKENNKNMDNEGEYEESNE